MLATAGHNVILFVGGERPPREQAYVHPNRWGPHPVILLVANKNRVRSAQASLQGAHGCRVVTVNDSDAVLRTFAHEQVSIVVVDENSHVDPELPRRIRRVSSSVPIVVLSDTP